jgi:phospholipid-binding lipoprotein MlaA
MMGRAQLKTLLLLNVVDTRAKYLGASDAVEGAALDGYSFIRDVYLQRRRSAALDGAPPADDAPAAPDR